MMQRFLFSVFSALLSLLAAHSLHAADHGVILLYHHVSDETPPSTSVSPARFDQHLAYLADHGFRVMALQELLDRALSGEPVPENAVAITFDDAYASVYTEAAPRLAERGWPFTVFLASQPLDDRVSGYMSWRQAGELVDMGGAIGAHSHSHGYLARRQPDESDAQWRQRIEYEIDHNLERIAAELGLTVTAFAYPYGEYNRTIQHALSRRELLGLAQQSGAVGALTDPRRIPRFPMASGHDSLERLSLSINSRPLPVARERREESHLLVELANGELPQVACYAADGEGLSVQQVDDTIYRIELPATRPGRNKINCTAPTGEQAGEFYWHSHLWLGE